MLQSHDVVRAPKRHFSVLCSLCYGAVKDQVGHCRNLVQSASIFLLLSRTLGQNMAHKWVRVQSLECLVPPVTNKSVPV